MQTWHLDTDNAGQIAASVSDDQDIDALDAFANYIRSLGGTWWLRDSTHKVVTEFNGKRSVVEGRNHIQADPDTTPRQKETYQSLLGFVCGLSWALPQSVKVSYGPKGIPEFISDLVKEFIAFEVSEGGGRSILGRVHMKAQVWTRVNDIIGYLQTATVRRDGEKVTMLDILDERLSEAQQSGETTWATIPSKAEPGTLIPLSFSEAWRKLRLEEAIVDDKSFRKDLVLFTSDATRPASIYIPLDRLDKPKIDPSDCQAWLNFESQMPDWAIETWRAAVYGIYHPENRSRQIAFLLDDGGSGKSSIATALGEIGGPGFCSSLSKNALSNQFWGSLIFRKRLILIPDSANPNWTQTDAIKQLTGGDPISIEFKGETPFMYQPNVRVLATTNTLPNIDVTKKHQLSRILCFPLESRKWKSNPNYLQELSDQAFNYLRLCRDSYEKLCPHHGDLEMPEPMAQYIEAKCTPEHVLASNMMLDTYLEVTKKEKDKLFYREIKAILKEQMGMGAGDSKEAFDKVKNTLLMLDGVQLGGAYKSDRTLKGIKLRDSYYYSDGTIKLRKAKPSKFDDVEEAEL